MKIYVEPCHETTNVFTPFTEYADVFVDSCKFMNDVNIIDLWDDIAHERFEENVVQRSKDKIEDFVYENKYYYQFLKAALLVGENIYNRREEKLFSGLQTVGDTTAWVRRAMFPSDILLERMFDELTQGDVDGFWEGAPFIN